MSPYCKLFRMPSFGYFPTDTESFQRLEDFSTYSSCIRCFGKSIISPLLTPEQRDEACRFRNAAVEIETDNVKKKKECSSVSDKVKAVNHIVKESPASCSNYDFALHSEDEEQNSALYAGSMLEFQTSLANDATIFSNEIHISKCEIPSTDICSTVSNNVIVSQKVIQANNDRKESPINDTKRPTSCTDLDEVHMVLDNVECSSRQDGNPQDLSTWASTMPYESAPTDQMHSVSEDELDSITESTDFGSLPTVIDAKQFHPQDTDNESNATCLTQSTDLEKYLDSSIDYSSPEDLALSRSNNLNSSIRSDDASSETLVNTGSESTPCASAMAVLGYADEARSDMAPKKNLSEALIDNSVNPRRSHSVDSYIKMAGVCAKKPPIRKSQSEPSYNESKNDSEISLTESIPSYLTLEDKVPKTKIEVREGQQEITPVSDSEVGISFESMAEVKKSLKRKHVRTNSYTLEHPSPALILAHADCNCSEDSPNLSPHSCSEGKIFHSPPILAFKKEKVHIILPPASERDRYFPILNSTSASVKKQDANIIGDSKLAMSDVIDETEVQLPEEDFVNLHENVSKSIENSDADSKQVGNSMEISSKESFEQTSDMNKFYASTQDVNQQNEQIVVSSVVSSESKSEDIKEFVNQVIRDVKETQKSRLNQFFEQQNKLWLQMQKEFKEQEILICEKLKVVDISTFSDGVYPMPYEYSNAVMQQQSHINQNISMTNASEVPQLNRNSNPGDNYLSVEPTDKELSEVAASQKSPESMSDTTNFEVTESSSENIPSSQSTTSTANTRQNPEIPPPLPNRSSSLTASNGSLQANSSDGYLAGSSMSSKSLTNTDRRSHNLLSDGPESMSETSVDGNVETSESHSQSSMSSKSYSNSDRRFQNHTLDVFSDRSEGQHSSVLETSVDTNLKVSGNAILQSSMSSKSYSNSERRFPNRTLDVLSDKPERLHSSMSEASVDVNYKSSELSDGGNIHSPMQSLYDSCPISVLSVPYFSESNCSSVSFRSGSNLSQTLDVFRDSHFLKGNNCPARSSVSPGVCACQGHGGRGSICPECSSCLKCCSFEQRHISYEALSDGGDRYFTTPISPSEFIPHPSHLKKKKNSTTSSLPVQNHGVNTPTLSFTSNNINSLDIKSSDTSNSDHYLYPITMNSLPDQFHGISPTVPSFKNSNIRSSLDLDSSKTSNSDQYLYPIAINSLPIQNNSVRGTTLSLTNNNISSSFDLNSSETSTPDQFPLLNNNVEPNIKQNVLIINTKNNLSEVNTPDDISYSEEEIRAINDMVQSSYASSYSSALNEDCLIASNNSSKNPSQEGSYKSSSHIPSNEKGALKQSISISLTNLKRRQSRDILKDPIVLKKLEKLPALVKGYLTRRLFKTERVQDLIRTLKDTALLVGKFSQELKSKGNSVSENDVDLHRQLISQLMRTFDNVYDIFCTTSVKEQMKIISESRNFRMKKKTTEKNESSASVISEKCRPSRKKPKVSAATLKALERKRSSINSRTFTAEDLKRRKPKVHSTTTTKSSVTSPARVYNSTIGTSIKRKTSVCKSSPWK